MRFKTVLSAVAFAAGGSASSAALAATSLFTFTAVPGGGSNFSFDANTSPMPVAGDPYDPSDSFGATITDATGSFAGNSSAVFYDLGTGGGLGSADGNLELSGPQLYSGTITKPTFLIGSYTLTDYSTGGMTGTLFISYADGTRPIASVPEPASWMMLIAGFGLGGLALRRRHAYSQRGLILCQGSAV